MKLISLLAMKSKGLGICGHGHIQGLLVPKILPDQKPRLKFCGAIDSQQSICTKKKENLKYGFSLSLDLREGFVLPQRLVTHSEARLL